MGRRIPRPEDAKGTVAVSGGGTSSRVDFPLGHGRGILRVTVSEEGRRGNALQLYVRWVDRPGDPVSVEEPSFLGSDKEYLTHVLLDLETGEVYPHYQSGDPVTDEILNGTVPSKRQAQPLSQLTKGDEHEHIRS